MKTIKIYCLPSHQTKDRTSGVDFVRVLQPMKYLDGYNDGEVEFKVTFFDIHKKKQDNWLEIAEKYDIIYLNYTVLDWQYAAMGACVHGKGKKIVMDLDDAVFYLRPDNIVYDQFKKLSGKSTLRCILEDVDYVTTTNSYLKNVICDQTYKRHEKVKIFPNYIDLSLYTYRDNPKPKNEINILHFGSTSHFEDILQEPFVEGLKKFMDEYPNANFITVGSNIPRLRYLFGQRYINAFGDSDIYKWINNCFPKFMEQADIVVAPLESDKYNRSKSSIKFLEYSSAKKPGIYQDIRQYQELVKNGVNGYLAFTKDDWYNSLNKLANFDHRKEIGESAFKTVQEWQIQNKVKDYAQFFKSILT